MMVVGALQLSGCKEQAISEPIALGLYFSFVTAEGGDFFESDTRYDANSVTFSCRILYKVYTLDNKSVFETAPSSCESIIDFGNGDQDTLKVEWLPSIYPNSDAKELEQVIYTYNGVVIDTWDFDPDLNFFYEMANRNGLVKEGGNNPIVINLPKTADENELN